MCTTVNSVRTINNDVAGIKICDYKLKLTNQEKLNQSSRYSMDKGRIQYTILLLYIESIVTNLLEHVKNNERLKTP